jgi:hypothetical protein
MLVHWAHDNDGADGMSNTVLAHRSEEHFDQSSPAAVANDEQIGILGILQENCCGVPPDDDGAYRDQVVPTADGSNQLIEFAASFR